jgi:hypothetical protein
MTWISCLVPRELDAEIPDRAEQPEPDDLVGISD